MIWGNHLIWIGDRHRYQSVCIIVCYNLSNKIMSLCIICQSFSCSQVSSSSGPDDPRSLCPVVDLQWHRLPSHDGQHIRLDMRSQSRWQEGNEKHVSLPLQPCRSLTALKWAVAWLTAIIWPVCLILVATGYLHHVRWTWNNSDIQHISRFRLPCKRAEGQKHLSGSRRTLQCLSWGQWREVERGWRGGITPGSDLNHRALNSWNSWWCLWRRSPLYKSLMAVTFKGRCGEKIVLH